MHHFPHLLIVCTLSFLLTAAVHAEDSHVEYCSIKSLSRNNSGTLVDLKGVFASSFEFSGFRRCGEQKDSWWWLDAPKHYSTLITELKKSPAPTTQQKLYIHVKACLSQPGNYGHMSVYRHQLEVIELYDYSVSIPEECTNKDIQP